MATQQEREAEVLSLMKQAKDPSNPYDGSDAMSRPEGDRGEED
ncbi:hypothetical protein [Microbacterium stercoris]|nr:hypothetical protein [Microbacterium stercoris]